MMSLLALGGHDVVSYVKINLLWVPQLIAQDICFVVDDIIKNALLHFRDVFASG